MEGGVAAEVIGPVAAFTALALKAQGARQMADQALASGN